MVHLHYKFAAQKVKELVPPLPRHHQCTHSKIFIRINLLLLFLFILLRLLLLLLLLNSWVMTHVGRWGRWFFSIRLCQCQLDSLWQCTPVSNVIRPSSCRSITVHHSNHHCLHKSLICHHADVAEQFQLPVLYQVDYSTTSTSFYFFSNSFVTDSVCPCSTLSKFFCNTSSQMPTVFWSLLLW